jgi:hypothetical protein
MPIKRVVNEVATKDAFVLDEIYFDLKSEIKEKDRVITELSIRL